MGVGVPPPKLLVVDEALHDVVGGVQRPPRAVPLVLRQVLALVGVVVLDPRLVARVEQRGGVNASVGLEGRRPPEVTGVLVAVVIGAPRVPVHAAVVVRPPPLAIAFGHGGHPIVPELELVGLATDEGAAVYQSLPVDYDLILPLTVTAANAVDVGDQEVVSAGGEAVLDCPGGAGRYDRGHLHPRDAVGRYAPRRLLAELVDPGRDAHAMTPRSVGEGASTGRDPQHRLDAVAPSPRRGGGGGAGVHDVDPRAHRDDAHLETLRVPALLVLHDLSGVDPVELHLEVAASPSLTGVAPAHPVLPLVLHHHAVSAGGETPGSGVHLGIAVVRAGRRS